MENKNTWFVLNLTDEEFNKNPTVVVQDDSVISKQRSYINAEGNLEIIMWWTPSASSNTVAKGNKIIISGDFEINQ